MRQPAKTTYTAWYNPPRARGDQSDFFPTMGDVAASDRRYVVRRSAATESELGSVEDGGLRGGAAAGREAPSAAVRAALTTTSVRAPASGPLASSSTSAAARRHDSAAAVASAPGGRVGGAVSGDWERASAAVRAAPTTTSVRAPVPGSLASTPSSAVTRKYGSAADAASSPAARGSGGAGSRGVDDYSIEGLEIPLKPMEFDDDGFIRNLNFRHPEILINPKLKKIKAWNHIPDLAIITGRNGSGKSSMLRFIDSALREEWNKEERERIDGVEKVTVGYFGESTPMESSDWEKEGVILKKYLFSCYKNRNVEPDASDILKSRYDEIYRTMKSQISDSIDEWNKLFSDSRDREIYEDVIDHILKNRNALQEKFVDLCKSLLKEFRWELKQKKYRAEAVDCNKLLRKLNSKILDIAQECGFEELFIDIADFEMIFRKVGNIILNLNVALAALQASLYENRKSGEESIEPLQYFIERFILNQFVRINQKRVVSILSPGGEGFLPSFREIRSTVLPFIASEAMKRTPKSHVSELLKILLVSERLERLYFEDFVEEYLGGLFREGTSAVYGEKVGALFAFVDIYFFRAINMKEETKVGLVINTVKLNPNIEDLKKKLVMAKFGCKEKEYQNYYAEQLKELLIELGIKGLESVSLEDDTSIIFQKAQEGIAGGKSRIRYKDFSDGEKDVIKLASLIVAMERLKIVYREDDTKLLLLMDEPDKHLDPELCRVFWRIIEDRFLKNDDQVDSASLPKVQVIMTTHRPDTISLAPKGIDSMFYREASRSSMEAMGDSRERSLLTDRSSADRSSVAGGAGAPRGGAIGPAATAVGASLASDSFSGRATSPIDRLKSGIFYIDEETESLVQISRLHALFKLTPNIFDIMNIRAKVYTESADDARFYELIYAALSKSSDLERTSLPSRSEHAPKDPARLHFRSLFGGYDPAHEWRGRLMSRRYQLSFSSVALVDKLGGGSQEVIKSTQRDRNDIKLKTKALFKKRLLTTRDIRRAAIDRLSAPFGVIDGDDYVLNWGADDRVETKRDETNRTVIKLGRYSIENFMYDPFILASIEDTGEIFSEPTRSLYDIIVDLRHELQGGCDERVIQRFVDAYFEALFQILKDLYATKCNEAFREFKRVDERIGRAQEVPEIEQRLTAEVMNYLRNNFLYDISSITPEIEALGEVVKKQIGDMLSARKKAKPEDKKPEPEGGKGDEATDKAVKKIYIPTNQIPIFGKIYNTAEAINDRVSLRVTYGAKQLTVRYPKVFLQMKGHIIEECFKVPGLGASPNENIINHLMSSDEIAIPADLAEIFFLLNHDLREQANAFVRLGKQSLPLESAHPSGHSTPPGASSVMAAISGGGAGSGAASIMHSRGAAGGAGSGGGAAGGGGASYSERPEDSVLASSSLASETFEGASPRVSVTDSVARVLFAPSPRSAGRGR